MNDRFNPYQPPARTSDGPLESGEDRDYLMAVIRYQKGVLLAILASFGAGLLLVILPSLIALLGASLSIAATLARIVFVGLLASKVYGSRLLALLLAILAALPWIGLIPLFVVNRKATQVLRAAGYHVGLLGVSSSQRG